MISRFWFLACLSPTLLADTTTWDNEATLPNGDPDSRWHSEDNWDTDLLPALSDDVRILTHGDIINPVRLSATGVFVKSVVSRVPFDISELLSVSAASEFENSLVFGGLGRIRADGLVTLNGTNDGRGLVLEGSIGFHNNGSYTAGTRGISAPFSNTGVVTLNSGSARFASFENEGIVQLGASGNLSSSSSVTNSGTMRKDNPAESSKISGTYLQTAGKVDVGAGAMLTFDGGNQKYQGGTLQANGTLVLSQVHGGPQFHEFDGLTAINGNGTVNQLEHFALKEDLTVNLPTAPGYQAGNLLFTPGKTLTNNGVLTFGSSESFEDTIGGGGGALFRNTKTVSSTATSTSNPIFKIPVQNSGTWNSRAMRIEALFTNTSQLILSGNFKTMGGMGSLWNEGTVVYEPETTTDSYTIAAKFLNQSGSTLCCTSGTLALVYNPATTLTGTVRADNPTANIRLFGSEYRAIDGTLTFDGRGRIDLGATTLPTELIHTNQTLLNKAGTEGLWLVNGDITTDAGGSLINEGKFVWQRGTITNETEIPNTGSREFENSPGGVLIIDGSGTKILEGRLNQRGQAFQRGSITLRNSGTCILNTRKWNIESNSVVLSANPAAEFQPLFWNSSGGAVVTHSNPGLSTIHTRFRSDAKVIATHGTLHLADPVDLNSRGILEGFGNWIVHSGAAITFPRTLTGLDERTEWSGPGSQNITSVRGSSELTVTETQTNPAITVSGGSKLIVNGTLTTPTVTLDGGSLGGHGSVNGNVVSEGGSTISAGTTVSGDVTVETTGTNVITHPKGGVTPAPLAIGGTASLGGLVRPEGSTADLAPMLNTPYPILNAGSVVGTYDGVDHSRVGDRIGFSLDYTPNAVTLTANYETYPGYNDWRDKNFFGSDRSDLSISGPHADPDDDGMSNLQEYVHATPPRFVNPSPVKLRVANALFLELTFPWADGMLDASFEAELGLTLDDFASVAHTVEESTSSGVVTLYAIRIFTTEVPDTAFVRLRTNLSGE